jgi:hypothetical protein
VSDYERFALVLDSDDSDLGRAAMRLLELGVDVLYANDFDEAVLQANEEATRLGAVLAPTTLGEDALLGAVDRICPRLGAGPAALVPVGPEPPPGLVRALVLRGVVWNLWDPYDERELRFVVTAAMAAAHGGERRKHPRIPTRIPTVIFMGRHRKDAVVHDLSAAGAYLACEHPFLEGSRVSVEIALPEGPVAGYGVVRNAVTADRPGRADVPEGMGVEFTQLTARSEQILHGTIRDWIGRFHL